jgi:hypothetical protein
MVVALPRPVGPWPSDLGLGAVDAQLDPVGGGVGEDIRQGVQPHAGGIGDGEATPGQQRSDLVHRAGDGGAVHLVQHRQGLVGQLEAEDHQGDQEPVAKAQAVVGAGAGGAPAWVAAALLEGGGPGLGQLDGQLGQVLLVQPGEARMGKGRTSPCWRRHPRMITPCGPSHARQGDAHDHRALAHQVVRLTQQCPGWSPSCARPMPGTPRSCDADDVGRSTGGEEGGGDV